MGRPKGDDDGESVLPLSALERLFEGEADPVAAESEEETSADPAPGPGASDG